MKAESAAGDSGWSTPEDGVPAPQPPDAPAAPTLTVDNQALEVSWDAPTVNGSAITDYDVRYRVKDSDSVTSGDQPGPWVTHTHVGTATTATIGSLTNGTAYQVQVKAESAAGDSGWSVSGQGSPAPQKPDAPAAPTVTVKNESLDVSWTAPAANGATISDYDVRYRACTATPVTCATNPAWGSWTDRTGETASDTATTATITGLTNGTAYQVRVRAANSAGDSGWSVSGQGTPAPQKPDAPSVPTLTVKNLALDVSWAAPSTHGSAITGYDVQYRACTATPRTCVSNPAWGDWTSHSHSGTGTTTTIGSLTNGTSYQIQVKAESAAGDSGWSSAAAAAPGALPPDTPAAPTVTVKNQALDVSWTAPSTHGAPVTGYNVQHRVKDTDQNTNGDQPGSWVSHSHTGTGISTTIGSLTNGTAYQVQVQATSAAGSSGWSVSGQGSPAPQKPDAPAAPTVTVKNESLDVSWAAPAANGATISDYDVQHRVCTATPVTCATNPAWGSWTDRTGETASDTATSVTLSGLTNGTAYQVQVRAANSVGDSGWSVSGQGSPAPQKPDAPAAPTVTVKNESLDVSWSAPSANGAAISDYSVQHRACTAVDKTCESSPAWGAWTDRSGETSSDTGTSVTLSGLTNGTAYQVQVRATNSVGGGDWSPSAEATPTAQKPDAPAAPALSFGDQSLGVSWSAPSANGAAISDYSVQYRVCTAVDKTCVSSPVWGGWTDRTGETASDTGTSVTLSGLTNGTAYQVQVRATNSVGDSAWSVSASEKPSTVPGAPGVPTLTVNDQSLGVSWSAPSGDGGSDVTGYKAGRCSSGCGTAVNWTVTTLTGTSTSTTLSSLTNGTAYQVRIAAVNRSGDSAWSTTATATPAKAPDTPAAPTLTEGPQQLSVSWTAPAANGAAISDYDVRYRVKDTDGDTVGDQPGSWSSLTGSDDPGTATSATITGLTNGTAYQVQVRATNSVDDSSWSTSASAAPEDKPDAPAAPALTFGDQSLGVSWSAPSANGAAISDYSVQYRACTATPTTCTTNPTWGSWTDRSGETNSDTATTATLTGLTNGTAYQVQVRATNSVGDSAWSVSASEKPSTVPDAPNAPTLTVNDQSLGVSWTEPTGDGGSDVTGYKTGRCSSDCGTAANWTATTLTGTNTSTTLTGLTNGTAYQVRIAAVNRSGDSSWSTTATATPAKAPDTPTAPNGSKTFHPVYPARPLVALTNPNF